MVVLYGLCIPIIYLALTTLEESSAFLIYASSTVYVSGYSIKIFVNGHTKALYRVRPIN
jgi:hypothetical protein